MQQVMYNEVFKDDNLTKKHFDDAGLDIKSAENFCICPGESKLIGTGLFLAIPKGRVGFLKSRSGLAVKHGIEVGAGVIDVSYRGEVKVLLRNHGSEQVWFSTGDRIAQLVTLSINPFLYAEVDVKEYLDDTTRGQGGFGSTGI